MNNMSDNTIGLRLAAFDYFVSCLINSKCIPLVDGICAESMVRIPALAELRTALGSGEAVQESIVDAAVECVEKFNESQIDYSPMPEFVKAEKKWQERQCSELVKLAMKSILKSQGRLM